MGNSKLSKKLIIRLSKYDGYCEVLLLHRKSFLSFNYWDLEVIHHVPDKFVDSVVTQYQERFKDIPVIDLVPKPNTPIIEEKLSLRRLFFES